MKLDSGKWRIVLLSLLILLNIFFVEYHVQFSLFIFLLSLVGSIAGLYYGSESFVDEAETAGTRLGMSGGAIGAILISLGSVADELFVSTLAALKGRADLGFGNIQGSNLITIIPFFFLLPIFFRNHHKNAAPDSAILVIASLFLLLIAVSFAVVPAYFAFFFFALFVIYFIFSSRETGNEIKTEEKFNAVILILSLLLIYFASDSIVNYSIGFSDAYNVPFFISGFIIAGIAGSLPEVFMTVISFRKTKPDMAFGVIVGSTIYKITLILGIISSLGNLVLTGGVWSTYVLLFMSIILLLYTRVEKRSAITLLSAAGVIVSSFLIYAGI